MSNEVTLPLAYDYIKGSLREQRETARSYAGRAFTVLAAGTAIIGIGLPLAFMTVPLADLWSYVVMKVLLFALMLCYMFVTTFSFHTFRPQEIQTLDNPNGLEELLYPNRHEFYVGMTARITQAFNQNQEVLDFKGDAMRVAIVSFILEAVLTVVAIAVAFAL